MNDLGYTKPLFILPFDHRSTFEKAGFENIASLKQIVYDAFKKSLDIVQNGAILVDEKYGDEILKDAKLNGFTILLTTEKSGEEEFLFEYGEDFRAHIGRYKPTFAKALIRVKNVLSEQSKTNLKMLSDYCHASGYKFLVEVLAGGDVELILEAISELQNSDIEPDVWKVEGMETSENYQKIIQIIKLNKRESVSLVILGRGEDREKVEEWIKAGKNVPGVIGFAIGRTVFWQPLIEFNNGKINRDEAIDMISKNYVHFYNLFTNL